MIYSQQSNSMLYRYNVSILCILIYLLVLVHLIPALADIEPSQDLIPLPAGFSSRYQFDSDKSKFLDNFIGLPYRQDGVINEDGKYALFADPLRIFDAPGLNCSGMTLEMSRFLLNKNITIATVLRDRLGDSGSESEMGKDWDFGWDLIMNISDGYSRRLLLPGNMVAEPDMATGKSPRGYDISDNTTWKELPSRLTVGHLYLVSFSVMGHNKGYGLQHYHVGLIYVTGSGKAWFYQTTGKSKMVNKRDLKSTEGQASFKRSFVTSDDRKRALLVLEVDLP